MKAKFSRSTKYVPAWDENDTLHPSEQMFVILKPLDMDDLIILMDAVQSTGIKAGDDGVEVKLTDISQMKGVIESTKTIFPKYVEVHNLDDESGPVSIDDLVSLPFYLTLSSEILGKLLEVSMPNEAERKN